MSVKWNGEAFLKILEKRLRVNLEAALEHLTEKTRAKVGSPDQDASNPGQPPHEHTGELHDSITYTFDPATLKGSVKTDSPHAAPLEFGTQDMAPRPFLRSTAIEEQAALRQIIEESKD